MSTSTTNTTVGQHDIVLEQGATYSRLFTFYSDLAQTTAIDMTGYSFKAEIRASSGGTVVETFTITNTDLANGQITISISDEETAALTPFKHRWDLLVTDGSGNVTKYVEGKVTLRDSITEN